MTKNKWKLICNLDIAILMLIIVTTRFVVCRSIFYFIAILGCLINLKERIADFKNNRNLHKPLWFYILGSIFFNVFGICGIIMTLAPQ